MTMNPGPTLPEGLPEGIEFCEHETYHEVNIRGDRTTRCRKCPSWATHAYDNPAPGFPALGPCLLRVIKRETE